MAKKETILKWRKEDERVLKKAISDFNSRVRKLNKTRKDKSYIPSEIDYAGTKDLITTRSELNRVLESLGRFKGTKAFKKVKLPSGQALTNWEYEEIKLQQKQAKRRIKKRMAEIRNQKPEYFEKDMKRMGNEEYKMLESTLEAIENFGKKKPSSKLSKEKQKERFEKAKARIENWASSDFEMRRAITYANNYFEMLTKKYSNLENYDLLMNRLKKIDNPLEMYEVLKKLESGEKYKDISYMYDATPYQRTLNSLLNELGVELEVDSETIEEGE